MGLLAVGQHVGAKKMDEDAKIEFTHKLWVNDDHGDVLATVKIYSWFEEPATSDCPGDAQVEYEVLVDGKQFEPDQFETYGIEEACWAAIDGWKLDEKYGHHD